jgi:hypothetical protein
MRDCEGITVRSPCSFTQLLSLTFREGGGQAFRKHFVNIPQDLWYSNWDLHLWGYLCVCCEACDHIFLLRFSSCCISHCQQKRVQFCISTRYVRYVFANIVVISQTIHVTLLNGRYLFVDIDVVVNIVNIRYIIDMVL